MTDDFCFQGRTVIVTGGNGGIGQGIVTAFSERDANVVVVDHAPALKPLNSSGKGRLLELRADITDRKAVDAKIQQAIEAFGRIDVLVNNAGGGKGQARITEVSAPDIEWMLHLNIRGTINCTQSVMPTLMAQRSGAIVNISSDASLSGQAGRFDPVYAGCKGFINSFTKALAMDVGQHNIRVNAVAPGWIVPEHDEEVSTGSFWIKLRNQFGTPESFSAEYARTGTMHSSSEVPLHRLGRPRDIAGAVLYFASDAARHATGQLLSISGGAVMTA